MGTRPGQSCLQHDLLNFIERDLVIAPVVELRGASALVRGHLLRVLEQSAVGEIDGDPGCPERVAAEFGFDAGVAGAPVDGSKLVQLQWHTR